MSLVYSLLIGGVIALFILAVLVFVLPRYKTSATSSSESWILKGDGVAAPLLSTGYANTFANNTSATLRLFYSLSSLPRTQNADNLTATSFNSVTNNYDICPITSAAANAGSCVNHPGFVKMLNFENSLWIELLQAPDASRPGLPKTQFCVRTTQIDSNTQSAQYIETFALPAFPLQKWIMLTLIREGSRFDIYYNDVLQASIRTTYVPAISSVNCAVGSPQIQGTIEYPLVAARAFTGYDVAADYKEHVDTKGEPLSPFFSRGLGTYSFSLCPSGNCFHGPTMKPANPLLEWNTNYM